MPKKVSVRQFAKSMGVSHVAVIKAIKAGRIEKNSDGSIDPEKARLAWEQNTDLSKKREVPGKNEAAEKNQEATGDPEASRATKAYNVARAVREEYAARTARLEYEQKAKSLVSAQEVKLEAYKAGRIFRETMMNLPNKICHELAAESDANKVHALLTTVIHTTLTALFDQAKSEIMSDVERSDVDFDEDFDG